MVVIPAVWRREARVQRILVVAIFFVASLQFFMVNDAVAHQGAIHNSLGGTSMSLSSAKASSTANSLANVTENLEFCGHCAYDIMTTCNERLKYMMKTHHHSEQEARENLMVECGIDYDTEPYVVLHAGPHKTGTTSIQSFLYDQLDNPNATFYGEDRYGIPTFEDLPGIFGGHGPMLNFAHCMIKDFVKGGGQMNIAMCNKVRFGNFPTFLQKHYNNSHHVILVAEDLDRLTIDHGRIAYYLRPYRRFKVVVNYRRLHDWLPSWYNQIMDLYLQNYILGNGRFPSFVEWINSDYHDFSKVHAIEVANRYQNSGRFESVEILNMHDGIDLLENVFCNYVPFASATCKYIKHGKDHGKRNIGGTLEYERLLTKAYLRKKINHLHVAVAKKKAAQVKQLVMEKGIFKDANNYPRICLNETFLDHLLQKEMEQEKKYFPEWYEGQGGDEGLQKDFAKAKKKLCSMDVEGLLHSGVLDPVFDEINK